MTKLNPEKVISKIDDLVIELKGCLDSRKDFEGIHKKIILLCNEILLKKEWKVIDVGYPKSMNIVFDPSWSKNPKHSSGKIQIPDEDGLWSLKVDLGKEILSVLEHAREKFALKLELL